MMLKNCPEPVDVQDIQFKLQCKLKIFNNKDVGFFRTPCNLISCASRYGLLFVGDITRNLQAIQLTCLENFSPKDKEASNYPRRFVPLPSNPTHISVNCDSTILAVVLDMQKCPAVIFYDILSFLKENISVLKEVRLSANPNVYVTEVNWNPSLPTIFTACKSDGTLGVFEIKDNSVEINELPVAAEATTFCWSPKGKQIAVGSKNGKITQYKPDLKAVKVINAPPLESVHCLISLQWVSNYQFLGIFQPSDESRAKLIVIDAPKTGEPAFVDYEDVCYSGTGRPPQFFLNFQQQWNLLMVASANSTEVAVLGLNPPETWIQWIISDSARAELPLSSARQETFPIGMTFDTSNTKPFPWGESTIPPCPYLLLLSHQGLLCVFNVINLKEMPSLCSPPDAIKDLSGLKFFITEEPSTDTTVKPATTILQSEQSKLPPLIKPIEQKQSAFVSPQITPQTTVFNISQNVVISSTSKNEPNQLRTPAALSQNLYGGQVTVTPIKPQINATSADKTQVKDKYSSIFSALNAPTTVPVPVQAKSLTTIVSESIKTVSTESNVQIKSKASETRTNRDDEENLLGKMIKEECISLDSELKALIHKGRTITVNIGKEEEKLDMLKWIQTLDDFLNEIVDISLGENAEVHTLKQNLVLSWAWYEEALSYYNAIKDKKMNLVLKSRPLDTVTDKRSTEIKKLMYYIESQLLQVNKELDEQWDNFQTQIKKTHRMQMPTMETIFQTMVRQSAVLQRQDYIMKDIRVRLKHKVSLHDPALLIQRANRENLEDTLQRLDLDTEENHEKVIENVNKQSLTKTKMKKLRHLLREHKVEHIIAIKPQLLQTSPLSKQFIDAKLSPLSKTSAKKLTFTKSMPTKEQQYSVIHVDPFKQNTDIKSTLSLPAPKTTSMFGNLPSAFAQTGSSFFSNKTEKTVTPTSTVTLTNLLQKPINTSQTTIQPSTVFKSTPFNFSNKTSITPVKNLEVAQKEPVSSVVTPGNISKTVFTFGGFSSVKNSSESTSSNTQALTSTSGFSFSPPNKPIFTSNTGNMSSNATSSTSIVTQSTVNLPIKIASSTAFDKNSVVTSSVSSIEQPKPLLFGSNTNTLLTTPNNSSIFSSTPAKSENTIKNIFGSSIAAVGSENTSINTKSKINNESTNTSSATSGPIFSSQSTLTTTNITSIFGSNTLSISGISNVTSTVSSVPTTLFSSKTSTTSTVTETPTIEAAKNVSSTPVNSTKQPALVVTASTSNSNVMETKPNISSSVVSSPVSIFSTTTTVGSPSTTQPSLFTSSSTEPQQGSIFSSSTVQVSIFGAKTTTTSTTTAAPISTFDSSAKPATTLSIFGSSNSNAPSFSFLSNTNNAAAPPVTQTSIFAASKPSDSVFGVSSAKSSNTSIFGQSANLETNAVTPASIFTSNVAATPTMSIFGTKSSEVTTSIFVTNTTSIFGTNTTAKSPGIFGTTTTSTSIFEPSTTSSFFGANVPVTTPSVFGSNSATTSSVFGPNSTTTTSSAFGLNTTTTTANIFGASAPISSNIFGASSPTTMSTFGKNAATTIFGSSSPATTSSIFGTNTSGNIFGSGNTTTAPTSIFGSSSVVTAQNVFGTNTSTPAVGIFGGSNTSSSSNLFKTDSSNSVFGSPPSGSTAESPINFGNLNVGNTTTSSNIFGSNTATVNPFDHASEQKSTFGGGNIFGTPSSTTSSIFGSTPSSTTSIFGSNQSSTFGTNTQQSAFGNSSFAASPSSTFGQSATFGQSSFGSTAFSSPQPGPFSGGSTAVGQTGFGSPGAFQKQSGFGGAPVFVGSPTPAFGGSPSFGAAPTFGSTSSFGSPAKVFGSNSPTTFGSSSTASSGFGNLANQNTIGFGNLAQQAATSTSAQFSGSSSFSNWR